MTRLKTNILIVISALLCPLVRAQSLSPQQIDLVERIETLSLFAPVELAYIQTSKDIYEPGEDLWFKVYLLDTQSLIPSLRSKTLYLQLIEEAGKRPVWEEKYEIQNGFSNGRVYLSTGLTKGNYFLAAYTQNSFLNDTTEFKAIRRIKIISDISDPSSDTLLSSEDKKVSPKSASIQFNTFPEGGYLISGIPCRMAFKAVNKRGEPINVDGTLFENNIPLLEFKSIHAGMGSFIFIPDKIKKYYIKLSQPVSDTIFAIQDILPEGMSLSLVSRNKETLSFKLFNNSGLDQNGFYLRVQSRGVVYGITTGKVDRVILIKIPLSLLPQGIAEVTLFNNDLVPVAERLVYVNNDRKLNISAELSEKAYPQRGKVVVKIRVKDENGQPVFANLGVSIFDRHYQNKSDSDNIMSHVYLSEQLNGKIYNPSYYFNKSSREREDALDLLLLTQGWRKYTWCEENLSKKAKAQQVISDGIEGLVTTRRKISVPENYLVVAFSPNIDSTKVWIPADSTGRFYVSPEYLKRWEGEYVYMKPLSTSKANIRIKLSDPFETINVISSCNKFLDLSPARPVEKTLISDTIISAEGALGIKAVTIKGRKSAAARGKYLSSLDSLTRLTDNNDDYVCRYNILNCRNHVNESDNRKPVAGETYLVETGGFGVYRREVYFGSRHTAKLSEKQLLQLYNLSRTKAYFRSREFYNPDYDKEKEENNLPDFRNTLLWEPSVFTDTNGEVTLSFYCSDINTSFVGRIEGVGGDGLLGTGYFNFSVRKVKFTP